MFSTHYHKLTQEFQNEPKLSLYHMDCMVSDDSDDVYFMYKLKEGVCPRSFGPHVARMAGIADAIVKRAEYISKKFQDETEHGFGIAISVE